MKITFTKTGKKNNWISVHKKNGKALSYPWPAVAAGVPHDLIHFVVESKLEIYGGFWGGVYDGINFDEMVELAANVSDGVLDKTKLANQRGQSLKLVEALVSAFTNTLLWTKSKSLQECEDEIRRCCENVQVAPPKIEQVKLVDALIELSVISERWNKLRPGESMEVAFDFPID